MQLPLSSRVWISIRKARFEGDRQRESPISLLLLMLVPPSFPLSRQDRTGFPCVCLLLFLSSLLGPLFHSCFFLRCHETDNADGDGDDDGSLCRVMMIIIICE